MLTYVILVYGYCFFFKQKTAYELRISDWSSDVCSSDLVRCQHRLMPQHLADGLEDRSLDLLALGRRFDHEPTGRHADDAVDRLDPFERGVACLISEWRRVGEECGSTYSSLWSPSH